MNTFSFFENIPVTPVVQQPKRVKTSIYGGVPQALIGIAGGVALDTYGKTVFSPSKSLRDFVVAVDINGLMMNTVLAFYSENNGEVYGYVDSPVVNCRFQWDSNMQPKISHARLQIVPALEFVRKVIHIKAMELMANLPENLSGSYGTYVSQLIADGHVNRPYLRRKPNSEKLIFVRAAILNPANIAPEVLPTVKELVDTWNQLVDSYRAAQDMAGFTVWKQGLEAPSKFPQVATRAKA